MNKNITAIEIAASGIKVVTGYYKNKHLIIRKALTGDKLPLDSSNNIDLNEAKASLNNLLNECKKEVEDLGLYVPIYPAIGLKIISDLKATSFNSAENTLTSDTYNNCLGQLQGMARRDSGALVTSVPFLFQINDEGKTTERDYSFELGTKSDSLTMHADCYLIDSGVHQRYEEILRSCISPRYYFELISPLAVTHLINKMLENAQRKLNNYVIVNFEKNCTHVMSVSNKRMKACTIIPKGYIDCVNETSSKLSIPFEKALELVNLFGLETSVPLNNALPDNLDFDAYKRSFSASINALLIEVKKAIASFDFTEQAIILETGSGSDILLLAERLTEVTNMQVIKFQPPVLGARDMGYLSCLGAIMMSTEGYLGNQASALRHQKDSTLQYEKFGRN